MLVIWIVMPYELVRNHRFGGTYRLHLQGLNIVSTYKTARTYIPKDRHRHLHWRESQKSNTSNVHH